MLIRRRYHKRRTHQPRIHHGSIIARQVRPGTLRAPMRCHGPARGNTHLPGSGSHRPVRPIPVFPLLVPEDLGDPYKTRPFKLRNFQRMRTNPQINQQAHRFNSPTGPSNSQNNFKGSVDHYMATLSPHRKMRTIRIKMIYLYYRNDHYSNMGCNNQISQLCNSMTEKRNLN